MPELRSAPGRPPRTTRRVTQGAVRGDAGSYFGNGGFSTSCQRPLQHRRSTQFASVYQDRSHRPLLTWHLILSALRAHARDLSHTHSQPLSVRTRQMQFDLARASGRTLRVSNASAKSTPGSALPARGALGPPDRPTVT